MTYINLMGFKPLEAASFYTADKNRNEITVPQYLLLSGVSLSSTLWGVSVENRGKMGLLKHV